MVLYCIYKDRKKHAILPILKIDNVEMQEQQEQQKDVADNADEKKVQVKVPSDVDQEIIIVVLDEQQLTCNKILDSNRQN